jgi:hypothetical protein
MTATAAGLLNATCQVFVQAFSIALSISNLELSLVNMQTCLVIKLSHQSCTHLLLVQVIPSFCHGLLQLR